MSDQPVFTNEITAEIARAITRLGGAPATIDLTDTWQVNRVLEFLDADVYLLATVGSWGDTLTDGEVLADLRRYNAGESLRLDISFSTG